MLVEANTFLQQEKLKLDTNREIANLEAIERRKLEFQQSQQKERERAMVAQQILREHASQELQQRIQLERKLAKQQQQKMLLQKQNEIERLEAQADKKLFRQKLESFEESVSKEKEASKQKQSDVLSDGTPSPESATVKLTDSDTPPPSQNKLTPTLKTPTTVVARNVVLELPTSGVTESIMSNITEANTQDTCVSEAMHSASGVAAAAGVLCESSAHAQAAVRSDSEAQGTLLPMADPVAGQAWYIVCTKPKIPVHIPEENIGLPVCHGVSWADL